MGPRKPREDAERRALARAVGPEEAEDLALADLERDVVHRELRPVALRQVGDADHAGFVPRGAVGAKPFGSARRPRIVSKLTIGCSTSTNAGLRCRSVSPRVTTLVRLGRARLRRRAREPRPRPGAAPRCPPELGPECALDSAATRARGGAGSRRRSDARFRSSFLVGLCARPRAGVGIPARAAAPSAPAPGPTTEPAPADMLLVPGGSFTMGADTGGEEDEHPAHTVTLPPSGSTRPK